MDKKGKKTEISRNTKILGIASFLNDVSSEMIYPILPLFFTSVLGAPVFILGVMESIAELLLNFFRLISGFYSDTTGKRKRSVMIGYGLSSIVKASLVFAKTWPHVFAVRILDRVGKGIRGAPRDSLIAQSEKKENLGAAFGFRKFMDSSGAIMGPLITGAILVILPNLDFDMNIYSCVFILATIPALLSVISVLFVREEKRKGADGRKIMTDVLKNNKIRLLLITGFLFSIGLFSNMFLILRTDIYLGATIATIAYLAYNVFYTLFAIPVGKLADDIGDRKVLAVGFFLFSISMLGFGFVPKYALVFFAFLGLFMAIFKTIPRAMIGRILDKEEVASGVGFFYASVGFGSLGANMMAGWLWNTTIFSVPFPLIFSAGIGIISSLLILRKKI